MNPIAKTLNRHKKANQEIQASTANFSRIYRDARMEINDMLRRHVLGRRNPLEGKHLVELIENLGNQYGEMEAAFREEFQRAIPYVAESYFFDCLHDLGKQAAGEVDQDRIELMMQDAFSHVAGATNNMFKSDVSFLREATATVFREASVTGKTRKEVSGELLGRLMARPEQFRFIDAKGRVWNNETYVEMLGRTVLLNAGRQTYFDTCIDNGKDVVRVTVSGDPCPNCAVWENRLLSITGQTQGLPTVQEAQQAGLLHPNCTHSFVAVGRYVQKNDFGADGRPNNGLNSPGKEERNDKEAWREYRAMQDEARRDDAIEKIFSAGREQVGKRDAAVALKKGFTVTGADGKEYTFGQNLQGKYEEGINRRQGSEPDRLRHLGRAVEAMRNANISVTELPNTNPPQIRFVHQLSEKQAIVVFAERDTGVVRSFIYKNKSIQGFLKKHQ